MSTQSATGAQERERGIMRVTAAGAAVNVMLSAAKLAAGILGRSTALVADAVHSLSDLASDLVIMVFVRIAAQPPDEEHDFGHGKFETLATLFVALALAFVGAKLFYDGAGLVADAIDGKTLPRPGWIAATAAAASIAAKEALFRWTKRAAGRLSSPALAANAWHHRSDALSSIGTFLGAGGALLLGEKWAVLDPVAAMAVALLVLYAAWGLAKPALDELMERSLPPETEREIMEIVASCDGARDPHNLRTRRIGPGIAIEVHVRVVPEMTVSAAHDIATDIESRLRSRFGSGTHAIVHLEPDR